MDFRQIKAIEKSNKQRLLKVNPLLTEESGIYLIPLYLFPIIPIGLKVYCISGDEIVNDGTNLDNDIRFGCIAYGIKPKKCR